MAYGVCLLAGYAAVPVLAVGASGSRGPAPPATASRRWPSSAGDRRAQVIGQAVLTGGPVVLALAGGRRAEVTALFAGLALFRAPYTLALGLVSAAHGPVHPAGGRGAARRAAPGPPLAWCG